MADQPAAADLPNQPNAAAGGSAGGAITPDAIDEILRQAGTFTDAAGVMAEKGGAAAPPPAADPAGSPFGSTGGFGGEAGVMPDQASIEELLRQASFDQPESNSPATHASAGGAAAAFQPALPDAPPFKLPDFEQAIQDAQSSSIDLLRDVELNVKIELGRSRMLVEDVLRLSEGSVVELDKLAGDPVDVFVNERLIARGEVLVLNDNFCVRVNEIVASGRDEGI